jgi:hypothetical protein
MLAITVILACAALAGDVGYLQYQKQRMQTAADSAALAAAAEFNYGDFATAAKTDAATNGFTDGASGVTVTVNNPPLSGSNAGKSQYLEVIVANNQPTYFMHALGINWVKVQARAVASIGDSPNCIYALDPSAAGAILANGNIKMVTSCGVLVDSSSSSGLLVNGNATISASQIGVVGNYTANGNVKLTPTPKTGIIPASDPLAYVGAPAVGACDHNNFSLNGNITQTLNPGVYCGGIRINGNSNITFNPGTYVLAGGGMTINGNATLTGAGITFYNTTGSSSYGAIIFNGNVQANLSAPTSGSLQGMLFFQDRTIAGGAGSIINGNSNSTFDGSLYFPTTAVTYNGNSSGSGYTIVVADRITINGNAQMNNNYTSLTNGSPIKTVGLAE